MYLPLAFESSFLSTTPVSVFTSRVTHVATQGMSDPPTAPGGSDITSWVKTYSLEYSSDGNTYNGYYFNQGLKVKYRVMSFL